MLFALNLEESYKDTGHGRTITEGKQRKWVLTVTAPPCVVPIISESDILSVVKTEP